MHFLGSIAGTSIFGFGSWGYVFIFAAALVEALPLLGLAVPGMLIVLAGGFMARLDILHIGDVAVAAALGAIIGDLAAYLLGHRYGVALLERYGRYVFLQRKHFDATERLMRGHAGKALVLGRFNSITRCFAPFIAGSTNTTFARFMVWNVIGGTLWAVSLVVLGFIFGHSYAIVSHVMGRYVTASVLAAIFIIYGYRFVATRQHIFARYQIFTVSLNVLAAYLFAELLERVADVGRLAHIDTWASTHAQLLWGGPWDAVFLTIAAVGNAPAVIAISIALGIFFAAKDRWEHLALLAVSTASAGMLVLFLKNVIGRTRPLDQLVHETGYSFPSGHATMATVLALVAIYTCARLVRAGWRRIAFIVGVTLLALTVALSRVYLNVHWISDVLAGILLGSWSFTASLLVVTLGRALITRWRTLPRPTP